MSSTYEVPPGGCALCGGPAVSSCESLDTDVLSVRCLVCCRSVHTGPWNGRTEVVV